MLNFMRSLAGLSPTTVMPGINCYLHEVSKDEASRLRRETAKRHAVNTYTFQSMPWPIKEDWNRIETIHPLILDLSYADGTQDAKNDWRSFISLSDHNGAKKARLVLGGERN